MLNKQKVQDFRTDFQLAVEQLEEKYGVHINLGVISFNANELRGKMTATIGEKIVRASKEDFNVGNVVRINHKTIPSNDEFEIIKINAKNIKVVKLNPGNGRVGAIMTVSPGLLIRK
tara:strand:+ start:381 stop:731 length:351 start_codon:yes stop_codon:yes gene_type:complete